MMTAESCYRVRMSRGDRVIWPIVSASNSTEAFSKAQTLAPSLLAEREPWLLERGMTRPEAKRLAAELAINIDTPILLGHYHPLAGPASKRRSTS